MPVSVTSSLAGLLQWLLPVLACVWAVRTHKSRPQIVLICVGAGAGAALFMFVPLVQMATLTREGSYDIPAQLGSMIMSGAIFGAVVGFAGVVVQKFGGQRARPEPTAR